MSIVVTGTFMPDSVAASVFEGDQRIAILHVPRHVSMVRACMQHAALIEEADIVLRTLGLDVLPGRYQVSDLGNRDGSKMAAFTARTGAVHLTTPNDDIGHVMLNAKALEAMGPVARRVVGDKPPKAHRSSTTDTIRDGESA